MIRPSDAANNPGIRPRSSKLATSEVMNTVLPARDRPVTPSRITGSKNTPLMAWPMPSTPSVTPSAMRPRTNSAPNMCRVLALHRGRRPPLPVTGNARQIASPRALG